MFVKSGQTKARGACIFSLPRVKLTRRAPCIYRTAAFENRNIGETLMLGTQLVQLTPRTFVYELSCGNPGRE